MLDVLIESIHPDEEPTAAGRLSMTGKLLLSALLSLSLGSGIVLAQDTATIVGTVTDSSGAAVPSARVTISNQDKGFVRNLTSNGNGAFSASSVPIGDYVVTAEAPGFEKLVRNGITLSVGAAQRVDMQLSVGKVTNQVTVTGNVPHVQTETAAVSDLISGKQIVSLNLNGRNFVALSLLVPGAMPDNSLDTSQVSVMGYANISFNGNRMEYSNWEIDGGNNADEGSGGLAFNTTPSLDSIAEFRISTSNYGAEMGRHPGANIEVVTKSGTKEWHGDAYEYVRNDLFDANDWFANRQIAPPGGNAPKTPLKRNEFGYTLGGPFYIPGHYNTDKSKTFFFWSEEWRRYRQGEVITSPVPSLLMRTGNFSECDPKSSNYNSLISNCSVPTNPVTGQPFSADTVPINPNGAALLDADIPLPNNGVDNYISAPSIPTNWREEQIRVDQNFNEKTSAFVRFTNDAWDQVAIPALWTSSTLDTGESQFSSPGKTAVVHLTHIFKPSLMNEVIAGYTVNHIYITPAAGPSSPAGSIDKPATWTASTIFAPNQNVPLLPGISVCGGTPFCLAEDAGPRPWNNAGPTYTLKDNVVLVQGNHNIKTGFYLEKYEKNEQPQPNVGTQGFMNFNSSNAVTTGNALADLYLGRMAQYQEETFTVNGVPVGGYGRGHWRFTDLEPYVQDDWKVSQRLTLNLGLRYYYYVPMHDVTNPTLDASFIPGLYNPALQAPLDANGNIAPNQATGQVYNYTIFGNGLVECGTSPIPKGCMHGSYGTWGPRFGFAYDPTGGGKTVIRGGYGIYYEFGNGDETNSENLGGQPPYHLVPAIYNVNGYQSIGPGPLGPASATALPLYTKWPAVQQFSFGVQHEFPAGTLVTVNYAGTLGRHLGTSFQINQVPDGATTVSVPSLAGTTACGPQGNCNVQSLLINNVLPTSYFVPYTGYSSITMRDNNGISEYNALQANLQHRVGHGVTFQAAYTWSHNIDTASDVTGGSGVDDSDLSRWRGTSSLNRTQVLQLNYVYDMPFFRNASNGAVRGALGGWELSGITSFFTGEPVDFDCGISGLSSGIGEGIRCNTVGKLQIQKSTIDDPEFGPTPGWFNPGAIAQPNLSQLYSNGEPGMFGYMGRNVLTGPGRNNWDMALLKNFELPWFSGEHSTLQFRWETFNTFNHPQWKTINSFCGGDTPPGEPCSGNLNNLGNGEVSGAWQPRIMQLALKLIF
jgi:hypothetical protein